MLFFRRAPVAAGPQARAERPSSSAHFLTYSLLSTIATAALVTHAFKTRHQFYPAVIYLVTSKMSVLILGNMGLMLTLLLGRVVKTVFLGNLRDVEVEILYDNARYAVTETCLALTIFREELTTRVLTLFTALLFCKSFHWLCQSRVEYVESDNVSRSTHIRLVTLMMTLLFVDVAFVAACIAMWAGPSVLILFGFEYAILAVSVMSTFARYILHVIDMNIEGNWPAKGSYLFFLEFATEVVRFVCYVIFFTIIFTHYGMPLHIVRDLWMSYVSLKRRLIVFSKYRKLTANMNERFPDATEPELAACEHTCIICRDAMDHGKKLPCSHIFHLDCLRLWLQQQQSCPTCRAEIPTDTPVAGAAGAAGGVNPNPQQQQNQGGLPQQAGQAAPQGQAPQPPAISGGVNTGVGGGVPGQGNVQHAAHAQLGGAAFMGMPPFPGFGPYPAMGHQPAVGGGGGVGMGQTAAGGNTGPANAPGTNTNNVPPQVPHQMFPAPPMSFAFPPQTMPGGVPMPPMAGYNPFPFPPSPFGAPLGMPGYMAPPFMPFPPTPPPSANGAATAGAAADGWARGQSEAFQVDGSQSPWFRVIDPMGAEVRDQPESSATVVRSIPQGEVVLCVGSQPGRDAGVTARRVLNGGWIVENLGADGQGRRLLERLAPSAVPPWTPFSTVASRALSSMVLASGAGAPASPSPSRPEGSSDLRYELQSARTSLMVTVSEMTNIMARYQTEVGRIEALLTRVEAAAAAAEYGSERPQQQQQEEGKEETKLSSAEISR